MENPFSVKVLLKGLRDISLCNSDNSLQCLSVSFYYPVEPN